MIKSSSIAICCCALICILANNANGFLSITCKDNAEQTYINIGHKFYFIWHSKVSWFEAAHLCRRIGGDLALIESAEEMDAISNYLLSHGYDNSAWLWTSGNDLVSNRNFVSITNGMPMPYTKWSGGQPDNAGGNEHCVHLWLSGGSFKMNDWICHEKAQVLCQSQNHTRCWESYQ